MAGIERLYSTLLKRFSAPAATEALVRQSDLAFVLTCNGYDQGAGQFNQQALETFKDEFKGQRTAFFGPNSPDKFYSTKLDVGFRFFENILDQAPVLKAINKYRSLDENQAARIAFVLGGVARHLVNSKSTKEAVGFVAKMATVGDRKSGESIVAAMAMYVISGGSFETGNDFVGEVFEMGEAISADKIVPLDTKDLGLSQVARLRSAWNQEMPDLSQELEAFYDFPTVGAEFHFPKDAPDKYPNFWQRLAILNMSQYQRGSYIQFSRNDKGVIEVRMNPSIYPVAVANWNHIRMRLPELNHAFFTITLNRDEKDFSWDSEDKPLLNKLRATGMLIYAGIYENIPPTVQPAEINFGDVYLGQTVKMTEGKYRFTGNWGGDKEGKYGQLAIYTGFGKNFPHLAYYLSMALANPDIFPGGLFSDGPLNLQAALEAGKTFREVYFGMMRRNIKADPRLSAASEAGQDILEKLNP